MCLIFLLLFSFFFFLFPIYPFGHPLSPLSVDLSSPSENLTSFFLPPSQTNQITATTPTSATTFADLKVLQSPTSTAINSSVTSTLRHCSCSPSLPPGCASCTMVVVNQLDLLEQAMYGFLRKQDFSFSETEGNQMNLCFNFAR